MKAITIINNNSRRKSILLTNFMDYTIDREDYILQIHRIFEGNDFFDNIQLKNCPLYYPDPDWIFVKLQTSSIIVEAKMKAFLANDEPLLDISEYVDQEIMGRGDDIWDRTGTTLEEAEKDEDEELPYSRGYCAVCGEEIVLLAAKTIDKEGDIKRYCSPECSIKAQEEDEGGEEWTCCNCGAAANRIRTKLATAKVMCKYCIYGDK